MEPFPAAAAWRPRSRLARLIATGFGSGYAPLAPGTAGSAVAALLLVPFAGRDPRLLGIACLALYPLAVWSAGVVASRTGAKDPGIVVIDEVLGMWVSLLGLPLTLANVAAGFLLFRLFDVVKPPPCRALERLPMGHGIVCDDVMAGVYANLTLRLGLGFLASP